MKLTLEQARRLYVAGGGIILQHHSQGEWEYVRDEMQAMVDAKTDRAAGRVIEWWGCWHKRDTATAFARRVRQEWKRMQEGGR